METNMGPKCDCPHHRMMPLFIVLFGVTFLLYSLGVFSWYAASVTWPIIVILAGLTKMFSGRCHCCNRM